MKYSSLIISHLLCFIISMFSTLEANAQKYTIHYYVLKNDIENVELCINRNVDVNWFNSRGHTPLMYAADNCNKEIVELLMKNGANPNILPLHDNTPPALHATISSDCPEITDLLLQFDSTDTEFRDSIGNTALFKAVEYDRIECMKVLMFHKANPNSINNPGKKTPLQLAASKNDTAMISILMSNGDDINFSTAGRTALSVAVEKNCLEATKLLIELGATISDDLMYYAASFSSPEMIDYLYSKGANINSKTKINNCSPLDLSIMKGNYKATKKLKSLGAKHSVPFIWGYFCGVFDEFAKYENRLGAQVGLYEKRYNMLISIGASWRMQYQPSLVKVSDHLFYQLLEKRTFVNFTLEKRFLFNNYLGAYAHCQIAMAMGKYDESIGLKPKRESFLVPGAGLYTKIGFFELTAGYKYYNYRYELEPPKNICNISANIHFGIKSREHVRWGWNLSEL